MVKEEIPDAGCRIPDAGYWKPETLNFKL